MNLCSCGARIGRDVIAGGHRRELQRGRIEHPLGEESMCGVCHIAGGRKQKPVPPSRDESATILAGLVERLEHTALVVVETAAMELKKSGGIRGDPESGTEVIR